MIEVNERVVLPGGPDQVRALLRQVPIVIPCIPGAWVGEEVGPGEYTAGIAVQYGDFGLRFEGRLTAEHAEDGAVRVRGSGRAGAQVRADVTVDVRPREPLDGGTPVDIHAEIELSGPLVALASSMARIVAPSLIAAFGRCLATKVVAAA